MNWIRIGLCVFGISPAVVVQVAGRPAVAEVAAAVGQVEAGNIDAAAQRVAGANSAADGSLAWYHQSSLVLLGWAEELRAAGEFDAAQEAATAALRMMDRGVAKGAAIAKMPDRAQLYVQVAMAQDRFFGNRSAARQYYELALKLVPDHVQAKAALAGYEAEAAKLRRFIEGGK